MFIGAILCSTKVPYLIPSIPTDSIASVMAMVLGMVTEIASDPLGQDGHYPLDLAIAGVWEAVFIPDFLMATDGIQVFMIHSTLLIMVMDIPTEILLL